MCGRGRRSCGKERDGLRGQKQERAKGGKDEGTHAAAPRMLEILVKELEYGERATWIRTLKVQLRKLADAIGESVVGKHRDGTTVHEEDLQGLAAILGMSPEYQGGIVAVTL